MLGMLDRIAEIPPEIYRTFEYEGETIRLHQFEDNCVGEIANTNEPYCRLSVKMDNRAPRGWFWLKNWSENKKLVDFLIANNIIELHPTESQLTGYSLVANAARVKPKTIKEETNGA